ncbi:hypothetical protein J2129_000358 [Methanofollis sp. W23]|uniref:hypothetical protein n=1 Tax=Methanofollis sp. W23 TaxID=2817849 RepID=UPI001AE93A63|nr:hypothetical protein [Methanofollis sp. W23]MBP2144904.1 hypothetical protein [Methanofollis sp. W23]
MGFSIVKHGPDDPERCEYFVRVEWSKTVPEDEAFWTKGLRASQNSAFKLRNTFTLERLVEHFGEEEG